MAGLEEQAQQAGTELANNHEAEVKALAGNISALDVKPQIAAAQKAAQALIEAHLDSTMKQQLESSVEQRKDHDMEGPGPETLEM